MKWKWNKKKLNNKINARVRPIIVHQHLLWIISHSFVLCANYSSCRWLIMFIFVAIKTAATTAPAAAASPNVQLDKLNFSFIHNFSSSQRIVQRKICFSFDFLYFFVFFVSFIVVFSWMYQSEAAWYFMWIKSKSWHFFFSYLWWTRGSYGVFMPRKTTLTNFFYIIRYCRPFL